MNWNGQRESLNALINNRRTPELSGKLQAEFNAKRRSKIQSAADCRPVYLPLQFNLYAAGQISSYRDMTDGLSYDVIIVGIKADQQIRDIIIRRTEDEKPIVYVGDEDNLFLRLDEIAGMSATNGGGQIGTFYLPSPILLKANNRITVEMFKTETTGTAEQANIVLIGLRVFNPQYGELLIDAAEKQRIEQILQMREAPRNVFLKTVINFDSAAAGGTARNIYTPQVQEPLLIRGVRTTLRHSSLEVRIQGEPNWTIEPTPCWAIAGEDELGHDNYQWFPKPIFLHSGNTIEVPLVTNSIDGTNIDDQTGNTITWICDTV